MRRIAIAERPGWKKRAEELGFAFHAIDGEPYWEERAFYAFTLAEIERDLEEPSKELDGLCRLAVDRAVRDPRQLDRLGIPRSAHALIERSWRRNDPSLYGRFDFSYDGHGPAKLLEYNADTPTALYEAAVFQWFWLEDQRKAGRLTATADQFNSIHERLVGRFADLAGQGILHLTAYSKSIEDRGTTEYIAECAREAGFATELIDIADVGLGADGQLYDLQDRKIERLFKLYPWEWLLAEPFAHGLQSTFTGFLEPPWKLVLSGKGLLPLLWEMAPGHPNLLPAYFDGDPRVAELGGRYARKPLYSREGANVALVEGGMVVSETDGRYGAEGFVCQALAPLPCFDGNHAVVGSWIIAGQPAGIGIREDKSPVTRNSSRFLPHAIVE
jgi:glutathionylspermidine synthase